MDLRDLPFEPTNSWAYRFARYFAIPEILAMPEVASGVPFRLIELSRRILDAHLTPGQQAQTFLRPKTGTSMTVAAQVKYYIPFIAKNTKQLTNLGDGLFRLPLGEELDQDDIEQAALEAGDDEVTEFDGWIYAFSFPSLVKDKGRYPIKVGRMTGDVKDRVAVQCRSSASFDNPIILGQWKVLRAGSTELAIHNVLKARGHWRDNVPGAEWFNSRPEEVAGIIDYIVMHGASYD